MVQDYLKLVLLDIVDAKLQDLGEFVFEDALLYLVELRMVFFYHHSQENRETSLVADKIFHIVASYDELAYMNREFVFEVPELSIVQPSQDHYESGGLAAPLMVIEVVGDHRPQLASVALGARHLFDDTAGIGVHRA